MTFRLLNDSESDSDMGVRIMLNIEYSSLACVVGLVGVGNTSPKKLHSILSIIDNRFTDCACNASESSF